MTNATSTSQPAAASGTFAIGGDLPVARLGFGTMRLPTGTFAGPVRDPQDGIAVLRRAVELGVNHIDTASFYRRGHVVANELIRRALTPYPDGLIIATKVGPMLGPDGTPALQATPGQLRALVEDNLRELGTDHLDLVYLRVGGRNAPGGEPVAERFAALAKLRADGLIRHLGVSNVDANELVRRALAPYPDGLVIATKVGPMLGPDGIPPCRPPRTSCAAWWRTTSASLTSTISTWSTCVSAGGTRLAASRSPSGSPRWRSCATRA